MKKFAKIFTMIAICFVCAFGFVACGKNPIVSAVVKNGTLITTVVKGETVDTSTTEVVLTYKDKTTKEITAADLSFSNVDTATVGTKKLTITYSKENYSFDVEITVVASEADVVSVISLESELVQEFNAKKNATGNERIEFMNHNDYLYAGTENTFHFRIKATGIDLEGNRLTGLKKVRTDVTVSVLKYSNWVVLSKEDVADYMTINTEDATFNFKDKATEEEAFRITVKAANPAAGMEEANVSFTAEVKVIDAFNVYTAKELSAYDNSTAGNEKVFDWTAIKQEAGVAGKTINAVILQSDISVTRNDVPAEVFWNKNSENFSSFSADKQKALLGTTIDRNGYGLYKRFISDGDEFQFIGNFFTVDFSAFPKMVGESKEANTLVDVEKQQIITSHFCAFYNRKADENKNFTKQTTANWKNVAFVGNGGLSEDPVESITNSGGLLMMKNNSLSFEGNNTISNNFYIGYFFELGEEYGEFEGNYVVDSCRGYYSYQCLFYMWGAKHTIIRDSEFKHASGPAIIADHVGANTSGDGGQISRIDVINSTIESKVTTASPWLINYGATDIITQISQANRAIYAVENATIGKSLSHGTKDIDEGGTTPKKYEVFDLVALIKSSSNEGVSTGRVQGYVRFFDNQEAYNKFYATGEDHEETTYGLDMMKTSLNYMERINFADAIMPGGPAAGNIYFQDSSTGRFVDASTAQAVGAAIASGTPQNEAVLIKGSDKNVADAGTRLTTNSKYVNIYIPTGMGAIFGVGSSK